MFSAPTANVCSLCQPLQLVRCRLLVHSILHLGAKESCRCLCVNLSNTESEPVANITRIAKVKLKILVLSPTAPITPHSSGGFVWQSVRNYYTELVIRNIEHLKNHETLENEVDFQTGYRKVVTYKK